MVKVLALAVLASFTFAQEGEVSPRTLFMSTAGSQVIASKKKEAQSDKTKLAKAPVYLGMNVQVYVPTANGMRPVNPLSHIFKTGDTFKVMAIYNTTGVVEFINIDPLGQVSYLGSWVIDKPFSGTMLPKEGWFRFTGTKGNEKLVVRFFPCQVYDKKVVEEFNSSSSRAIQVVPDAVQVGQVSLPELPICNYEQFQKRSVNANDVVNSRGIIVSEEKSEKKLYYLTSYKNYVSSNEPIVAVLNLRHR